MMGRFAQIISPTSGEVATDHQGTRIGVEYPVLEVITTVRGVLLRGSLSAPTSRQSAALLTWRLIWREVAEDAAVTWYGRVGHASLAVEHVSTSRSWQKDQQLLIQKAPRE